MNIDSDLRTEVLILIAFILNNYVHSVVGCRVLSTSSFGPLDSGRHLLSAYFSRASTFIFNSATVSISVTVLGLVAKTSWIKFVLGDVLV